MTRHTSRAAALLRAAAATITATVTTATVTTATVTTATVITTIGATSALAQRAPQPFPAATTHTETFFGTAVPDPYRALEDVKRPEIAAWMKAQGDHAFATLAALPHRERMLAALRSYDQASGARVRQAWRVPGGRLFYEKRSAGDNQYKLYTRDAQQAQALLVDPEAFARASKPPKPHAINWWLPSDDGHYVAYGVSQAGSEDASLRVIDVTTGQQVGATIPRADFGGIAWRADNRGLYFTQLQALAPGASSLLKYQNARVMSLTLGAKAPASKPVLMRGSPGTRITPQELPFVSLSQDDRYAFAVIINGVQREQRVYVSDAAAFHRGAPRWKLLFDHADAIVAWSYAKGTIYAITHKGAPRYRLLAGPLQGFSADKAVTLIAPGDRVLTGVVAAADAIYIEQREGNIKRLSKLALITDGRVPSPPPASEPIALPVDGAFTLMADETPIAAANPRVPGLLLDLQGWTRARQIMEVMPDGTVRNTGLQPAGPNDQRDDLEATEMQCKSHDGALVPMSVIHKKGLAFDGELPTLLYGYASYGVSEEPFFSVNFLPWLDAGGVMAIANPRGSGALGQDWYKGGFQATKPNTWKDFIACAETLIAKRVTSPSKLGIFGGSAGGILVGRAMTERPDLFAAVVSSVGALDMVRAEVTPNGVPNIPEFGTRKTKEGFESLLAMSTYHQIKDGVSYPAVLFTHGINDPRVEVWQSTKTAARLAAASTSGKPVLLRLDADAGHGVGNTKAQQQAERADIYAFLLQAMGVKP